MNFLLKCVLGAFLILSICYAFAKANPDYGCMLHYVNTLQKGEMVGVLYDFAPGSIVSKRHIEPGVGPESLEKYRIGKARGCIMESNDWIKDSFNAAYCAVTYFYESL